jgi:hypothetical protein
VPSLGLRAGCRVVRNRQKAATNLEHGLKIGRAGFWLMVNEEQYQKLKARGPPDRSSLYRDLIVTKILTDS